MSDKLNILISALLEKASKEKIETELKQLGEKLKPINIKVNVDKNSFDKLASDMRILQDNFSKMGVGSTEQARQQVRLSKELSQQYGNTLRLSGQISAVESTSAKAKERLLSIENSIAQSKQRNLATAQATSNEYLKQTHQWNKMAKEISMLENLVIAMKRIPKFIGAI